MCAADKVWITELTLIHNNISSVHNWYALYFIGQSEHIMASLIKTITSVLKVSTDIITSITPRHIGLTEILEI